MIDIGTFEQSVVDIHNMVVNEADFLQFASKSQPTSNLYQQCLNKNKIVTVLVFAWCL